MQNINAEEIFEIAIQIERNGGSFYRQAAAQSAGEEKQLFTSLAEMEDGHAILFTEMRRRGDVELDIVEGTENEVVAYLHSIAAGKVIPGVSSNPLNGNESSREILQIAIGFEKDAVVFFTSLRALVAKSEDKQLIDDLVKQELGHVADLQGQLNRLG